MRSKTSRPAARRKQPASGPRGGEGGRERAENKKGKQQWKRKREKKKGKCRPRGSRCGLRLLVASLGGLRLVFVRNVAAAADDDTVQHRQHYHNTEPLHPRPRHCPVSVGNIGCLVVVHAFHRHIFCAVIISARWDTRLPRTQISCCRLTLSREYDKHRRIVYFEWRRPRPSGRFF